MRLDIQKNNSKSLVTIKVSGLVDNWNARSIMHISLINIFMDSSETLELDLREIVIADESSMFTLHNLVQTFKDVILSKAITIRVKFWGNEKREAVLERAESRDGLRLQYVNSRPEENKIHHNSVNNTLH